MNRWMQKAFKGQCSKIDIKLEMLNSTEAKPKIQKDKTELKLKKKGLKANDVRAKTFF